MKRLLLLSLLFSSFLFNGNAQVTGYADQNSAGTASDPIEIRSVNDLIYLSHTQADWHKHFIQTVDIDFGTNPALIDWNNNGIIGDTGDTKGFFPIADNSDNTTATRFMGAYNGNNHIIKNLYINRPSEERVGLFGFTYSGAIIENLGIVDCNLNADGFIGAFAGISYSGTYENCFATGKLIARDTWRMGGFVGHTYNQTFTNCYSHCNDDGSAMGGGIVGHANKTTATNCYTTNTSGYLAYRYSENGCSTPNSFGLASNSYGGTRKTTTELQNVATFSATATSGLSTAWDFINNPNNDMANNDVWFMKSTINNGYPTLSSFHEIHDVTFYISDGNNPIIGASINLSGYGKKESDAAGNAQITVVAESLIPYTVNSNNYHPISDNVSVVDADITENVVMNTCITSTTINEDVCNGESFSVGDSTYSQSGTYLISLKNGNANGCDSVVTLNLTVHPLYNNNISASICEGEQFNVGDSSYTTTGVFITKMKSQYGCDSIVSLNLTVNPLSTTILSEDICEGESFGIGDSIYSETGTYVTTINGGNQYGCDSVVTLNLNVNPTYDILRSETICQGESISIGDSVYKQTGLFTTQMQTNMGCDSAVTLDLTVNPTYNITRNETICEGETISIGDSSYSENGSFTTSLQTQAGCDSIIILNLTVNPLSYQTITASICQGETYEVGDSSYSETGTFINTLHGANQYSCDSTVTLHLTVHPTYTSHRDEVVCEGDVIQIGDSTYGESGIFVTAMKTINGCDSAITLNLNVLPAQTILAISLCQGESYTNGDSTYTSSGTYTIPYKNILGCDSTVIVQLEVSSDYCVTYVPDDNFEQLLIDQGRDSGPLDDYVSTANINKINILNLPVLSGRQIKDMTGIEDFVALQQLNCSNHLIDSLNLQDNVNLTQLYCANNLLDTLYLGKNSNLTVLHANNNLLQYIDLSANSKLANLKIDNNDLLALDLSKNINLQELECYQNNSLGSLNLNTNSKLYRLNCGYCGISSLDLSGNPELYSISCSGNTLTNLDISENKKVYHLLCGQNDLLTLNLQNGNINAFSTMQATANPNLSCILVDDVAIAQSKSAWYKDAPAEYRMDCRPQTYIPDDNFEAVLIALGLDTIGWDNYVPTEAIDTLKNLRLVNTDIADLEGLQDFVGLERFICAFNPLDSINLKNNTKLTTLGFGFSPVESIDLSNNPLLDTLNLASTLITELHVQAQKNIRYLNCESNKLTRIDLSQNNQLSYLNCKNNELNFLNIHNGSNGILNVFKADNNPNLSCIMVDDVDVAETKTTAGNWSKDASASYSLDCRAMTYVPDDDFEQALIDLGLDDLSAIPDYVPTENIDTLKELHINGKDLGISIDSLTGIEDFTSLTYLDCGYNNLTKVNFSHNTQLEILRIDGCKINTIDISMLSNLEVFGAQNCSLSSLNISSCPLLSVLDLDANQLSALDLSTAPLLKELDIEENLFAAIDVSLNPLLSEFDCSENLLTVLDLRPNAKLNYFNCSDNLLSELNVKNGSNDKLYYFNARENADLLCIEVDDTLDANNTYYKPTSHTKSANADEYNWFKDDHAQYSENCMPDCEFSLSPKIDTIGYRGGTFAVNVLVNDPRCTWSAIEYRSWVRILSGKNGSGNGTVKYWVMENNSSKPRSFTMQIAGITYKVTQEGAPCTYQLSKNEQIVDHQGGTFSLEVISPYHCEFNLATSCSWISTVRSDNTVQYTIEYNSGTKQRSCQIIIEDQVLNITQAGNDQLKSYIPDDGFEQALIELGLDAQLDDSVKTMNIDTLQSLDLNSRDIYDMTGIEDFIALKALDISNNRLIFSSIKPVCEVPFIDNFSAHFSYAPQANVGIELDTTLKEGCSFEGQLLQYLFENQDDFHWYKNGNETAFADWMMIMDSIALSDSGTYVCHITNPIAPELTLYSRPITLHVEANIIVGVEELNLTKFQLYPNPAKDRVRIVTGTQNPVELSLMDIAGRQMALYKYFTTGEIDISHYPNGIYLVKVRKDDQVAVKRLVIR